MTRHLCLPLLLLAALLPTGCVTSPRSAPSHAFASAESLPLPPDRAPDHVAWFPVLLPARESGAGEEDPGRGVGDEQDLAWWPLAQHRRDPKTGVDRTRILGPIGELQDYGTGRTETTLRPLYGYMRDPVREVEEHIGLWPVFQAALSYRPYGPEDDRVRNHRVWLFPVFLYNRFSPVPGEWETDWFAPFPFVIGGDSTRDGSHFAVLPIAGTLKGLLGADEITFIGGPLYAEVRERSTRTWHFPYPLLRWGEGPRYQTHAVLPLYAWSRQDDDYERTSVLWPFVNWGEDNLSNRWPRQYWSVFPFAMRSWTAQSELLSILPPFFNHERIENSDTTILDAPWPVFRLASGANYEAFRIWPLYTRTRVVDDWTTSVAWPFIWVMDDREALFTESRVWVLPFFWSRERDWNPEADGTVREDGSWHLWPLARREHDVDGAWRIEFPGLLPPLGERFDRLYGPLLRFAELEGGAGRSRFELLWGLAGHESDQRSASWQVWPLINHESWDPVEQIPGGHEWNFLLGLLGHRSERGAGTTRLLWFIEW